MRNMLTAVLVLFLVVGSITTLLTLTGNNKKDTETSIEEEQKNEETTSLSEEIPQKEEIIEEEEDIPVLDDEDLIEETDVYEFEPEAESEADIEEDEDFLQEIPEESARSVIVNTEKVNLRMEPNSQAKIITVVHQGDVGTLIEEGEGWSQADFDGNVGYISNKCIDIE